MLRLANSADIHSVIELVGSMGLFDETETQEVKERLQLFTDGRDKSLWFVYEEDGLEGIAYCMPEPMTQGTWNILMLLVREDKQNKGHGLALVSTVEKEVICRKGRLLIVETSGTDDFRQAQRFYEKNGFAEVARIPDFYDFQNDKIIFIKRLDM